MLLYEDDFIDQITYPDIDLPKKLIEENPEISQLANDGDVESIFKIASLLSFYSGKNLIDNEIFLYRFAARWNSTQGMLNAVKLMLKYKDVSESVEYCFHYLNHLYKSGDIMKELKVVDHLVLIAKQLLADNPIDLIASHKQLDDLFDKIDEEKSPEKNIKNECEFELSPRLKRLRNLLDGRPNNAGLDESVRHAINAYEGFIRGSTADALVLAKLYENSTIKGEPTSLVSAKHLYKFASVKGLAAAMAPHLNVCIQLNDIDGAHKAIIAYLEILTARNNRTNSDKDEVRVVLKSAINVLKFAHNLEKNDFDIITKVVLFCEKLHEQSVVDDTLLNSVYTIQSSIISAKDPSLIIVAKDRFIEGSDFRLGQFSSLWRPVKLVDSPLSDALVELDQQYPWMHKVTQNIRNQIRSREFSSNRVFKIRPILLVGLPGGGKTTYCKALAEIIAVPFRVFMAAGSDSSMAMRGVARGYATASPGFIPRFIAQEKIANSLILVDELDKCASGRHNGSLHDVLLQLLEPSTSAVYYDEALEVRINLSHINWIATANSLAPIPKPLLSRFEVILAGEPDEKGYVQAIIKTRLDYAKELRVDERMMPALNNDDIEFLVNGCKSLREISKVTRRLLENRMCVNKPVMH